jgi:hypothetical protein
MIEQEIIQLENKVNELTAWKNSIVGERLTYPLDDLSRKILQERQWVFTGKTHTTTGLILTDFIAVGQFFRINTRARVALACRALSSFTANAGTDVLTNTSGHHNLKGSDRLVFATTNTLPDPLSEVQIYYPVSITESTFKVSTSEGGSAEDIIDAGTGTHYYAKL